MALLEFLKLQDNDGCLTGQSMRQSQMKKSASTRNGDSNRTKRRTYEHIADKDGELLLQSCLPAQWVLRPYRPDYGIDYSLEIFRRIPDSSAGKEAFETLGEHLFIQLKSSRSIKPSVLRVRARNNVEKLSEHLHDDVIGKLDVVKQSLDRAELTTIDRMGVGVPVMLVIADLASHACYFVCLNDYIDKILTPRFGANAFRKSRSIDIPILNKLSREDSHAFRWYGERAKMYAGFQRFVYQNNDLKSEVDPAALVNTAHHFASRIAQYDFWDDTEIWKVLGHFGSAVRHFLITGNATALRLEPGVTEYETTRGDEELMEVQAADVLRLWQLLANLAAIYEDVCREWFLPTALGCLTSYTNADRPDTFEEKFSRPNKV